MFNDNNGPRRTAKYISSNAASFAAFSLALCAQWCVKLATITSAYLRCYRFIRQLSLVPEDGFKEQGPPYVSDLYLRWET